MTETILTCVSVGMLGVAIYQLGRINGSREGWEEARSLWRPWVEREIKSGDEWRTIAIAAFEKSQPRAAPPEKTP